MLFLCTLVYISFILIDFIPILKSKNLKNIILYSVIILTSYTLTFLRDIGVKIPSIATFLKQITLLIVNSIFKGAGTA
ncbi:hypothetical protein SAMN05443428_12422 [Caloramator quimbayensis]|uniref:Uncharacterized protein n=1 Tax=Caloramator quimbayensis TaxID=1147123 RepID=A0A1T4Y7G9_9CLOT|nr:hypothetical protein SAMN05443428_12422 [Caloramator quimbayensis]